MLLYDIISACKTTLTNTPILKPYITASKDIYEGVQGIENSFVKNKSKNFIILEPKDLKILESPDSFNTQLAPVSFEFPVLIIAGLTVDNYEKQLQKFLEFTGSIINALDNSNEFSNIAAIEKYYSGGIESFEIAQTSLMLRMAYIEYIFTGNYVEGSI